MGRIWSKGNCFYFHEDLIFMIFELTPPLGFKKDNIKYNFNQSKKNILL